VPLAELACEASIISRCAKPFLASSWQAASTLAASKVRRGTAPRRMMWQSSLPLVETIAEWPPLVSDRK